MSKSSQFTVRRSSRLLECMSNHESGSGQFALRRSTRLLGKSSNTKPQCSRIKPRKSCDRECPDHLINYVRKGDMSSHLTTPPNYVRKGDIVALRRRFRKYEANHFRRLYTIRQNKIMERKTYICSGGTSSRMVKSSGFTWVVVHGMDSICAVVWNKARDVARLSGFSKFGTNLLISRNFAITLISEIEDLADSPIESCQTFDQTVKKPFAIVSVMPSTTHVDVLEESDLGTLTAVSNEEAAVKYLQEKMKSDLVFTSTETTQTAISALQRVVHQKLKATDIWVAVLEYTEIRHLRTCAKEKLLVVINQPDSGGSSSSG